MAQQLVNNGDTGLLSRTKINSNFSELYGATTSSYPRVATFSALPLASTATNLIYVVETATGIWPLRKASGLYLSDGSNWTWLGNEVFVAAQITYTPTTNVLSTNAQAAIQEVDDKLRTLVSTTTISHYQTLARGLGC
jgi:enamine deaminase RidA (YjgF/YER057c/UK114 family)